MDDTLFDQDSGGEGAGVEPLTAFGHVTLAGRRGLASRGTEGKDGITGSSATRSIGRRELGVGYLPMISDVSSRG